MTKNPAQRQRWSAAVWTAIGAVLVAALLNGALSQRRQSYREQVAATEQSIARLVALRADVVDAETGQRGFLLSGDSTYLEPYRAAEMAVHRDLDSLRKSVARGFLPRDSVERLVHLANIKMSELAETVGLREIDRGDKALSIMRGGSGRQLMDSIRVLTSHLALSEMSELDQRRIEEDRSGTTYLVVLLAGAGLTILALLFLLRTLREYDATQRAAEREMNAQIAEMEALARERHRSTPA